MGYGNVIKNRKNYYQEWKTQKQNEVIQIPIIRILIITPIISIYYIYFIINNQICKNWYRKDIEFFCSILNKYYI